MTCRAEYFAVNLRQLCATYRRNCFCNSCSNCENFTQPKIQPHKRDCSY